MSAGELHTFLAHSLTVWDVQGSATEGVTPVVVEIHTATGAIVWIERAAIDTPFRWMVRWRKAGEAPGGLRELRPRACSSLVGLLAAVREALDVDRGNALRIVPAPTADSAL